MSDFANLDPCPYPMRESAKSLGELMVNFCTQAMSTASLKDSPFGDDRFMISRTLVFWIAKWNLCMKNVANIPSIVESA